MNNVFFSFAKYALHPCLRYPALFRTKSIDYTFSISARPTAATYSLPLAIKYFKEHFLSKIKAPFL